MKPFTMIFYAALALHGLRAMADAGHSHDHDHDHGAHAHEENPGYSTGEGETFEYGWSVKEGQVELLVTDWATNQPLSGVTVEFYPDAEPENPLQFEEAEPGVYTLALEEEPTNGQIVVTYPDESIDLADMVLPENAHDDGIANLTHSHLIFYLGFALLFILGVLLGFFIRRQRGDGPTPSNPDTSDQRTLNVAVVMIAMTVAGLPKVYAHAGHSHAEASIGSGSNGVGVVSLSKKSQMLIGMRTVQVEEGEHQSVYKTLGHISALPQFDAWLTAPRSGILTWMADVTLGSKVKKGQVLARIDAISEIQIRAPFDGVLIGFNAVRGVRINGGDQLFRVVNRDRLWVDAEVYQRDFMTVGSPTRAFVSLDGNGKIWTASYVGARTAVSENSLNAHVFFELDQVDPSLPLGATAKVEIQTEKVIKGFAVPRGAVVKKGGESVVFVKTGVETFEERPVQVNDLSGGDQLVITKGLKADDRVVVIGSYQLLVGAN